MQLGYRLAATLLAISCFPLSAVGETLNKIEITATNNYQSVIVEQPEELKTTDDNALTTYVFERARFQNNKDPQLFIDVMDWVASQWQHDGMNQPPAGTSSLDILKKVHDEGERYRCVEYGQVMADILSAMGHHTRQIGLQTSEVAYGGFGMGHVATEVWSNALGKWVFFDPQFSIYALHNGEYLNIHDIYQLKRQQQYDQIQFLVTEQFARLNQLDVEAIKSDYANFLSNYLGFHISSRHLYGERQRVFLMMEAKTPPLTFQGMGSEYPKLFTQNPDIAYPELNKTSIAMTALPNAQSDFQTLMEEHGIETNEQYLEHQWRFAAKGEISMQFYTAMDRFSHFQIRQNREEWVDIEGESFVWPLNKGENRFEVRSISETIVAGPITFVDIRYSL
ncbi:transglutaminase-like domain-containing protein [Ferrimonas balearica]|uniref:transglutaminase-like domain-containing protein n=1 Tax=Ferrimonas balearica TaxID=44012 RepID=UPI001C99C569|nr:transglutaminase-like domain-containing protein [Ferrimonas balearica]MBY5920782.1 transglutaminase-like domain-containing protein [Ferrimonas balearica]MBY5996533.1 transglutaminase-like domain-containing protein [Ferrimonas balearica]